MVGVLGLIVRSSQRLLGCALVFAWSATVSSEVLASENFPAHLAEKLGMDCVPSCYPCHTSNPGRAETLRGAGSFIDTLRVVGRLDTVNSPVLPGVPTSLDAALDFVATVMPPLDSDMDGTPDLKELKDGTDVNGGDQSPCDGPEYGCGLLSVAQPAPNGEPLPWLGLALGVALYGVVRRRRQV